MSPEVNMRYGHLYHFLIVNDPDKLYGPAYGGNYPLCAYDTTWYKNRQAFVLLDCGCDTTDKPLVHVTTEKKDVTCQSCLELIHA